MTTRSKGREKKKGRKIGEKKAIKSKGKC